MNRVQAMENLKSFGIEEPTEDQITDYLNQIHGESRREKDRADKLKEQADKVAELQAQLESLNNANLSEVEQANKATEKANEQIATLQKQIAQMQLKAQLAEKGIIGEDADNLIDADGKLDIETLGKIISDREIASASAKEKELLEKTPNPMGNLGGGKDDEEVKPADLEMAEKIHFMNGVDNENKDYYKL